MLKRFLITAGVAGMLATAGAAQASFPLATGVCQGHVCQFANDTIKTRSVGSRFFVESLNTEFERTPTNVGRWNFANRERQLPAVGDFFRNSYSAVTLSEIYTSNDIFITDQRRYDRALRLYNRGLQNNNQALIRRAEREARHATLQGGTIIAVIGQSGPFELFPTSQRQVPGTDDHPVFVGSNPGNIFAPGVRELGFMRRGGWFNAKFYDRLSARYDNLTDLMTHRLAMRERRLERIAKFEREGRPVPEWARRQLVDIDHRIERLSGWIDNVTNRAIRVLFGSSEESIAGGLEHLLGFSFDSDKLTSLVGLDIDGNRFMQFFPENFETGTVPSFAYVSLITDNKGRTFIGVGVVSQHHRHQQHGV